MTSFPTQPPESIWHFVEDLQSPLRSDHHWAPREAAPNEASLADGVTIHATFSDDHDLLKTAYDDMADFLRAGNVPLKSTLDESTFVIKTRHAKTSLHEEYRLIITRKKAIIAAADTEGIRRGLFYLQDEMLRRGGPFLEVSELMRRPIIRTRISRCFFGPINRPPKNRDELVDEVDYYPDQYLNRLAHHGVNGLWLSVKFCDLCPSRFFPDHGQDSVRRLEKLRKTVQQCARYGIKIYIFCIEPRGFGSVGEYMSNTKTLEEFPQLKGHQSGSLHYFCTSSTEGQEYLESCTRYIFSQVPDLGGLIDINLGERPTHCYSSFNALFENNCPRCSQRSPGEVFADTLRAMQRGMKQGNPDAELVSWLYVPYLTNVELAPARAAMAEIAAHIPSKVLLQVNFESNGTTSQWGRDHRILDYSLAWVGPSEIFAECAAALPEDARLSAKLQVGNSHEVATVPFVPVPGNLYRKYQKMRELGVSAAMQCWYFGNYPSVMTQAAGELSFDTISTFGDDAKKDEAKFLHSLAKIQWGESADIVTQAWHHFRAAYEQFPATLQFSWFGPVHDCISWPLHVTPVDEIIQKSWQLADEVSGDRVAECFAYEFSQEEIIETCRRMDEEWQKGVQLLQSIKAQYSPDLQREIGVAQALGLQFRSAYNVMQFYALRDELPFQAMDQQLSCLQKMRDIAREEIVNSEQLMLLAQNDSRLGFHSEAEGYKYFPAKLAWRIKQIKSTFDHDYPNIEQQINKGKVLFPQFYGIYPQDDVYRAPWNALNQRLDWNAIPREICHVINTENNSGDTLSWQAAADEENLYIAVQCEGIEKDIERNKERVTVTIEPRRCWPSQKFSVDKTGKTHHENRSPLPDNRWNVEVKNMENGWRAEFVIPWICLREKYFYRRPIRINVSHANEKGETISWQKRHPLPARLIFGTDNSADYGWIVFEGIKF